MVMPGNDLSMKIHSCVEVEYCIWCDEIFGCDMFLRKFDGKC